MGDHVRALSISRGSIVVVRFVLLSQVPLSPDRENVVEKRVQMVRRPVRLEQDNDEPFSPERGS